jgi:hypothetical protein
MGSSVACRRDIQFRRELGVSSNNSDTINPVCGSDTINARFTFLLDANSGICCVIRMCICGLLSICRCMKWLAVKFLLMILHLSFVLFRISEHPVRGEIIIKS